MFKYIVFDLDNTLYNYDKPHTIALNYIFNIISNESKISIELIKYAYDRVNKEVKCNLLSTASSHSRIIYFKNLITTLNISHLFSALVLNNLYWKQFYNNMLINDNIIELLSLFKINGIKLGIITNFTLEHQYKKLEKLNILHYFDIVLSSEDSLFEKPHPYIFLDLKEQCKCNAHEILIIGDSYINDIEPALKLGFNCNHLNLLQKDEIIYQNNYISFNNTKNLHQFWNGFINELKIFVNYSKRIGERFDLTQAGGGNISFKYENLMVIKASGVCISDTSFNYGYSIVNTEKLFNDLNKTKCETVNKYTIFNLNNRPSIETYMHSFLEKITVHIHPLVFLRTLIKKYYNFNKNIEKYLIVDYFKPGIELAYKIFDKYTNQNIILLKNHGIIVTGNTFKEVFDNINIITENLEKELNISYCNYKFTNKISLAIDSNRISYLCNDIIICKYLEMINTFDLNNLLTTNNNFYPDKIVYCGISSIIINNELDLNKYKFTKHNIIIYNNNLYIISDNLTKCKQIEETIKCTLLISYENNDIIELKKDDIIDLQVREDEKYRFNN